MSSILKALKKLEDEKSIRKPDSLKIDAEILRGDASRRFSPMGILLLAALLFVCGSGATYMFMIKHDKENIAVTTSPESSGKSSTTSVVSPVAEKPQDLDHKAELPKPDNAMSARSDNKLDKIPASSVKPAKLSTVAQPAQPIKQSDVKRPDAKKQQSPDAVIKTTATVTPSLKVNGIAFQDESADRVAIVNGMPVSNGSFIEGAKVEDIQMDRVRFSYKGEKFEIALGKSNQ